MSDMVKCFLNGLEPDDVAFEYISAASIKDHNGQEVVLKGAELLMLLNHHPTFSHVKDARIYIDLSKIMKSINLEVDYIYEQVEMMFKSDLN